MREKFSPIQKDFKLILLLEKNHRMETVLVQLTHQNALKLLLELEELQVIRLLKKNVNQGEELAKKYAGKLPVEIGEKIKDSISKSREEWDKSI